MIDAYCHVGMPRFGTTDEALDVADAYGITRSVFSMGPRVPDFETLFDAMRRCGDRVRVVGIPFGDTLERQLDMVERQIRAGVMGIRMQVADLTPDLISLLGEAGQWIYAMFIFEQDDAIRTLLDWLENYPNARIAAPHFLRMKPHKIEDALRDLVGHPRFFPILSRQGNDGSADPYPHDGLKPWVEQVIDLAGWDRVMWGSEYPIVHWRNERMSDCQHWLRALLGSVSDDEFMRFGLHNAQREIFDADPPSLEDVAIPEWVNGLWNRDFPVPFLEAGEVQLPMALYERLHTAFVGRLSENRELIFGRFVSDLLAKQAEI